MDIVEIPSLTDLKSLTFLRGACQPGEGGCSRIVSPSGRTRAVRDGQGRPGPTLDALAGVRPTIRVARRHPYCLHGSLHPSLCQNNGPMAGLTVSLALACSLAAIAADQPPKLRLAEVQNIVPEKYRADLTLDPDKAEFSGSIRIQVKVNQPVQTIWLNANRIKVTEASVIAGGKTLAARTLPGGDDFLGLQLPSAIGAGAAEIAIRYTGEVRRRDSSGVFQVEEGGRQVHPDAVRGHRCPRCLPVLRRAFVQGAVAAHAAHSGAGQGSEQHATRFRNQRCGVCGRWSSPRRSRCQVI